MIFARAFLLLILVVQCYSTDPNEHLIPDDVVHLSSGEDNNNTLPNIPQNDQFIPPLEEKENNTKREATQESGNENVQSNDHIQGKYN